MLDSKICCLCGRKGQNVYAVDGDRQIVKCHCGMCFVYLEYSHEELYSIYGTHYFESKDPKIGYANYLSLSPILYSIAEMHLDIIEKLSEKGNLLDVGCATGEFLEVAKKRGWTSYGIEISEYGSNICKQKGLNVSRGILGKTDLPENYFDVITAVDVLEHTPDPYTELLIVNRFLKEGGLMCLSLPNFGSLRAMIERKDWWAFYSSREHLYFFTPKTITALLKKAGFTVIYLRTASIDITLYFLLNFIKKIIINKATHDTPNISYFPSKNILKRALEIMKLGHVLLVIGRKQA